MWKMVLEIGGWTLLVIVVMFLIIMFIAAKNHFGWFRTKEEKERDHWKQKYYSTKKEGL